MRPGLFLCVTFRRHFWATASARLTEGGYFFLGGEAGDLKGHLPQLVLGGPTYAPTSIMKLSPPASWSRLR